MRRDKTPLLLMEQLVTLLVFALAAAVCLQAFVTAERQSRQMAARDHAVTLCQNAAEYLRQHNGDGEAALEDVSGTAPSHRDGFGFFVSYDGSWTVAEYDGQPHYAAYTLLVQAVDSGVPGLGKAQITCCQWENGEMTPLFALDAAWQEVSTHG